MWTPELEAELQQLEGQVGQAAPSGVANSPKGIIKTFEAGVDYNKDTQKQARDANIDGLEFIDPSKPPTEESAKKMRDVYSSYKTIKDTLNGLRGHYNEYGAELLPQTNAARAYATKMGTLTGELKKLETLGALDAGVMNYVNSLMTPPVGTDAINKWGFDSQMKEYEDHLDNKINNALPTYGYKAKPQPDQVVDYTSYFKPAGSK